MPNLLTNPDPLEAWHMVWCRNNPQYEERPVDIRTFINSPLYLNAREECWEGIKDDLAGLFVGYDNPDMLWQYNEAVFDEGIGAGKSYRASIIISYLVYRTLILKDPQTFLRLAKGSGIYFINMSIRSEQAKKVVFGEIKARIENSPWFRKKGYLPDDNIKSELRFAKNINVIPGNSKETFPLGFNLLGGVMDEAAWYTDTEDHDVAEEMFNALYNRMKNRFGDRGMLIMISSPRYVDDFIERKMEEAKTNPKIYSRRATSWQHRPKSMFSGEVMEVEGYTIPIEFANEAKRNWERFKRDFMAIPSLVLEPYFKRWELVERMIDKGMEVPMDINGRFKDWFKGKGFSYYMHIDLSLTTDATGIAMAHREGDLILVDLAMRIKAPVGGEIDLAEIRGIVYELKQRNFSIQKCTFDQFQSASSIQDLNKMGIASEKLSVDKDLMAYETLKEGIYTAKVKTYPNDALLGELRRLELIEGKKVDHPKQSSKDIADAVAGAVYNCVVNQSDVQFWFGGKGKTPEEEKKEDLARTAEGLVPYGYYRGRRMYS